MSVDHWTDHAARAFWAERRWEFVLRYPEAKKNEVKRRQQERERDARGESQNEAFNNMHADRVVETDPSIINTEEADHLRFWMKNSSWTFCSTCNSLLPEKLLPSFSKKKPSKSKHVCSCQSQRYYVPSDEDVPALLLDLTSEELRHLRPFDVHCGEYVRHQHGYRERTGPFRVTWSKHSVRDKISAIADDYCQRRLERAFTFLMSRGESAYRDFVIMNESGESDPQLFEIFSSPKFHGIECALWPSLYHTKTMCESILEGSTSRESGKIAFMAKLLSPVAGYQLEYELMHYQYDRWLFKTVTGAINTARISNCSAATSLQHKTFSSGYWKWQHRILLDAVKQYGFPTFFLTISPYEWSFPWPPWLESLRAASGCGPTELPAIETMHIAHVLEQLVRGYLCGSNTNRWRNNVFGGTTDEGERNLLTYFYRFEFQQRGTVHLHLLVWLKDARLCRSSLFHASIPWNVKADAFTVASTQKSDKSVLNEDHGPDRFEIGENGPQLRFHYTAEDQEKNIRAYITTLLGSLKCRTDLQCTDGNGMVLKYVASYVSKWHDETPTDSLHSSNVTGFQAACSFLRSMHPLEPEMVLQLSSVKMSWTSSRTKRVVAPTPDFAATHSAYQKYLKRQPFDSQLTFVQWLRMYNETPAKPSRYRSGDTLVGVQMFSYFNPVFFYQFLAMYFPHSAEGELHHEREEQLPKSLKFFVKAAELMPEIWNSREGVKAWMAEEGHQSHFVDTVCSFVSTLHDIQHLWEIRAVDVDITDAMQQSIPTLYALSPQQQAITNVILDGLNDRQIQVYPSSSSTANAEFNDEESYATSGERYGGMSRPREDEHSLLVSERTPQNDNWRKIQLILGKPGTGKSQVLVRIADECLKRGFKPLMLAPVALLAAYYKGIFGDSLDANTIHSAFRIPVIDEQQPGINFTLADYDILLVDEASMISKEIFHTMSSTLAALPRRPLLVMAGDKAQQQPIATKDGKTVQVPSVLNDGSLAGLSVTHGLYQQFRCVDKHYAVLLEHIRYWKPTQNFLDSYQEGRVCVQSQIVRDRDIWQGIVQDTSATVLTVSRKAADRVNSVVVDKVFVDEEPVSQIACEGRLATFPVYKGMRVMLTQNRDKERGFVNGQRAVVVSARNNTIILRLPDQRMVFSHPITSLNEDGDKIVTYPFTPAYGLTICKAQGATLNKVLLWLDCPIVPEGTAYVGMSRVRRLEDITFLNRVLSSQVKPVCQNAE